MAFRFKRKRRRFGRSRKRVRRFRRFMRRRGKRAGKISYLKLRNPTLFPDALFTKMQYTENIILNDAAGAQDFQIYRMNDIYSPQSAAGTKALGFDQFAAFYLRWECLASLITFRLINQDSSVVSVVLWPDNESTTDDIDVAKQYPYAKWRIVGDPGSAKGIGWLSQYMTIRKFEGRRTTDTTYTGSTTASPTSVRYWILGAGPVLQGTSYTLSVECKILYWVRWYVRKALDDSPG